MTVSNIRQASDLDCEGLVKIAEEMGFHHEPGYFERCLLEQRHKNREIFLAESAGVFFGYIQLIWSPNYPPFKRLDIPEIQDLNVVPSLRKQGLGRRFVETCENAARAAGKTDIGISVGLYARYGAAQRLYVAMGYVPDGAGVCYDDVPVSAGDVRPIDDLFTLKFIKKL